MKTMLIVENQKGRERLYNSVEQSFSENEALVKITDTLSVESSTLIVPVDSRAEVIARESPKLLPGGVTALISYVKVPTDALTALEHRMEKTEVVSQREISLRPERVGKLKPEQVEPSA